MTRLLAHSLAAMATCWAFSAACFWAGHRIHAGGHRA